MRATHDDIVVHQRPWLPSEINSSQTLEKFKNFNWLRFKLVRLASFRETRRRNNATSPAPQSVPSTPEQSSNSPSQLREFGTGGARGWEERNKGGKGAALWGRARRGALVVAPQSSTSAEDVLLTKPIRRWTPVDRAGVIGRMRLDGPQTP